MDAEVAGFFTVFAERRQRVCARVVLLVDVGLDMERRDIFVNITVS
jgi:hypothetical protein